jgi:hypothetical protein
VTTKRNIILTSILFVCFGVWLAIPRPERLYQGRPLGAWLKDLQQWSGDTNDPAFVAFRQMGTNAVSDLLALAQRTPSHVDLLIRKVNKKQSLIKIPEAVTFSENPGLMWAFLATGTNLVPALPTLTNMLFHTKAPFISGMALVGIGSEGVPFLLEALTNREFRLRLAAASVLGQEQINLNQVVPALLERLADSNPVVVETAIISLGELHSHPEIVVPALITNYSNTNQSVRTMVLISLMEFQTNAKAAIPLLRSATIDSDLQVRTLASNALIQVADPSPESPIK